MKIQVKTVGALTHSLPKGEDVIEGQASVAVEIRASRSDDPIAEDVGALM